MKEYATLLTDDEGALERALARWAQASPPAHTFEILRLLAHVAAELERLHAKVDALAALTDEHAAQLDDALAALAAPAPEPAQAPQARAAGPTDDELVQQALAQHAAFRAAQPEAPPAGPKQPETRPRRKRASTTSDAGGDS